MPEDKEVDEILNELKHKNEDDNSELCFSDDTQPMEEKEEAPADFELVDEKITVNDIEADDNSQFDLTSDDEPKPKADKKKIIIAVIAVIVIIAVAVGVFAAVKAKNKEPETTEPTTTTTTAPPTTQAPVIYRNPLTNEPDYNVNAIDKRPVGVVVENAQAARPQWGMDDKTNAPDIIIEGEVEGGETRMLWMFADYTALPQQVGPIRSARPPFIKFSELFDSIFVHWGQSQSKGNYIGADSVFSQDNVDHINQMAFSDKVGLYGRDKSRGVSSEHTGVLYGKNLPAAIEQLGFRTDAKDTGFTTFSYNDEDKALGETACNELNLTFSSRSRTRTWTYNSDDKLYHTSDYQNDVTRKNLLVLFDTTEYIVKENYKNGKSETYCNYKLAGGSGKLISLGTVVDINWSVNNGKLVITDTQGNEINMNTGKTWIGWASANKGGASSIN